jgi:hypothetical protein
MGEGTGVRFPPNLECILIVPITLKTGTFESGTCEKAQVDGPYTKAIRNAKAPEAIVEGGGALPVTLTGGTTTTSTEFQNAAGVVKGTGLKLTVEITTASAGSYKAIVENVKKGAETCKSPGEAAGVVKLEDTLKLRFDSLSPLGAGILFNLNEITIECGAAKIKIKGNVLGLIAPINSVITSYKGNLHCSATVGEPSEVKYWEETGVETTTLLLGNFGTGFKKSCEEVGGEIALTASKSMQVFA